MEEVNTTTESLAYGTDIRALNEMIQKESAFIDLLFMEMDKVIVGQRYMVERLMIGLLADGHILLEGVPGLAKHLPSIHFLKLLMPVLAGSSLHPIFCLPICWAQ